MPSPHPRKAAVTDPSPGAPSRVERRRARTREALLSAAQELLATRPAEAINVDEIAELADVAKGTFYNYFTDKDALVQEVEGAVRTELEARIVETNLGVDDAAERAARAFAAALDWALAHPVKARALLRMTPHFVDPEAPLNAGARRDIQVGLTSGRFSGVTHEAGVVLMISIITGGINRALDLVQRPKVRVLGENLTEALLIALGLTRPDAAAAARTAMAAIF